MSKMKQQNIYTLDKMMTIDSLSEQYSNNFSVTVSEGYLTIKQANLIVTRSTALYDQMETLKEKIYELYGQVPTVRLMENFSEIIAYSDKVLMGGIGNGFDDYFQKLESFCGQIENILKMIRYYYSLFKK